MLSLHYHELMGKIQKHEGKTYLMVDDYMLGRVLDKIKETIGIEKFDDTRILIDTDTTLKKVVLLMTCIIKDGTKFYPQLFLKYALYAK